MAEETKRQFKIITLDEKKVWEAGYTIYLCVQTNDYGEQYQNSMHYLRDPCKEIVPLLKMLAEMDFLSIHAGSVARLRKYLDNQRYRRSNRHVENNDTDPENHEVNMEVSSVVSDDLGIRINSELVSGVSFDDNPDLLTLDDDVEEL